MLGKDLGGFFGCQATVCTAKNLPIVPLRSLVQ